MFGDTLCKHNQSGFCKYKLECRKRHENKLCSEASTCTSKECQYRHPKVCRNYNGEGKCRFRESCSYKHEKEFNKDLKGKEVMDQHTKEINSIKEEMNKLKEVVSLMEKQIMVLNQELQTSKETNVGEVVKLVVSLLDDSKASAMSSTEANQNEISTNCDICDFKCENEKLLITHMSEEHEECHSCYFCGKYFGTKRSLKYHNEVIHFENKNYNFTESKSEETVKVKSNEVNHQHEENKSKKKKKQKKK